LYSTLRRGIVEAMRYLRGTWMRGGTSKCWLFDAGDLAGEDADAVLAAAFGAGDPRQLDGIGGATSTTSKAAIVRRPATPGGEVEYTFAQVGIGARQVEWGSNCGNCATAIGLYALQGGLVPAEDGRTTVRLRNTNTGTRLATTIPTPGGRVPETGSALVPGATVGGVPVRLAFLDPAGNTTGALLPTGRPADLLPFGDVTAPASLVDAGAPAAFVDAAAFGLTGIEPVEEIAARVAELAALRREAALRMGLASPGDPVSHALPKVGIAGPALTYRAADGTTVPGAAYDISVRMVSMHAPHPAIGLTSAVALAAASFVPGSVVARLLPGAPPSTLRVGTPAGVVTVHSEHDARGPKSVSMDRAARRIAVAEVSVPLAAETPAEAAEGLVPA
jgi:2-methylaconitate cis-trans-isomerase PrpF